MNPTLTSERVSFECQCLSDVSCPNCGHAGMQRFYRVRDIPAHSCLLMPTRAAAEAYPRRDLDLAECPHCGFIANTLFDPTVHEYSPQYEETQGFSPTFNAFARELAEHLVDHYKLRGKTVLEIGCGKGEFLETMCELGIGKGIGFDPAYVPQRRSGAAAERMQVIQDFYSERYTQWRADMIVCRHTLEHIDQTLAFMGTVRRAIGDARDTVVCIEVPDAVRVLHEGAFWDVYYEHCSYFTPVSLSYVCRAAGFEVTDLWRAYDGQYLLITAVPTDHMPRPKLSLEQEHGPVKQFGAVGSRTVAHWRSVIDGHARRGERVVVWGSGSKGVALLTTLGIGQEVGCVVDINPYRHHRYMPGTGHRIVPPEFLHTHRPDLVIVMNPVYRGEVAEQLRSLGIDAPCVAV